MAEPVILVEHDTDLGSIRDLDLPRSKIITLDFLAHKGMSEAGIRHECIEDYFDPGDEGLIDGLIKDKSTKWYKDGEVSPLLEFEGVNLGWLLECDLFSYMTNVIKKFVGLARLARKAPFDQAHCSGSVSKMVRCVSPGAKISTLPSNSEDDFRLESFVVPLKVGGRLFHLRLSRRTALLVKGIVESLTGALARGMSLGRKTRRRLLLLDFDIVSYEGLLAELSKRYELVMLNERKPVIWGMRSLRISRRLGCRIMRLRDAGGDADAEIARESGRLRGDIRRMFENVEYFSDFFSTPDASFWPVIQDHFVKTAGSRFEDSVRRFILARGMFEEHSIDAMMLIHANAFEEKMIITAAKAARVPGIVLEHGHQPALENIGKYLPVSSITFDPYFKHGLWGQRSRDLFLDLGIRDENLLVVGSPRHDRLFAAKRRSAKKIVLFDAFITEVTFRAFDTRYLSANEELVTRICRKLSSLQPYDFSVKLHPGPHVLPYSIKTVIEKLGAGIPIHQTESPADLLPECALVVAPDISTVILEAMIMGIPTITCIPDGYRDREDVFAAGASVLVHTYEEFERGLDRILDDEAFRKDLISKGREYARRYFAFPGASAENVAGMLARHVDPD